MRNSITIKIFAVVTGLFLFILVLQWIFISNFFDRLYINDINANIYSSLDEVTEDFHEAGAETYYKPFEEYSLSTGSPVLALRDDFKFADTGFLNKLTNLRVQCEKNGEIYTIPVSYLAQLDKDILSSISHGTKIQAKLVQVGNSDLYEPLLLTIDGIPYSNRTSMHEYTVVNRDVDIIKCSAEVLSSRNYSSNPSTQNQRAELIYDHIKDCLIAKSSLSGFFSAKTGKSEELDGSSYCFISTSSTRDGVHYYFLTLHNIIVTGYESAYLGDIFKGSFVVLAVILIAGAYILARQISKPMQNLNSVTNKIAHLDFSEKATYEGKDEIGQLAHNINTMASSLKTSLQELKTANQNLEIASENAKSNEERMKRLLGDVSHEFKTPLALIGGYADVLRRGINEQEPDYYLDIIIDETANLTDMVNEAIELTKIQSGYWNINIGEYSSRDMVDSVLNRFSHRLENQGFTVETRLCDVMVSADAHRIDQVLSNFISNAIKYADSRRLLQIRMEEDDHNLIIYVENSGAIDDDILQKIWNRNFSVDQHVQARLPSQGIGLDIVKSILDAHHSHYAVSQKDSMVCFSFTLPIIQ